jgi:hypothetical protein
VTTRDCTTISAAHPETSSRPAYEKMPRRRERDDDGLGAIEVARPSIPVASVGGAWPIRGSPSTLGDPPVDEDLRDTGEDVAEGFEFRHAGASVDDQDPPNRHAQVTVSPASALRAPAS